MPFTLGTKIMPIGPSSAIICASWPAPLGSAGVTSPSFFAAASIAVCTEGVASAAS